MGVDEVALTAGIAELRAARSWPAGLVDRLADAIAHAPDEALHRIDPLAWPPGGDTPAPILIELFVRATHARLFTLGWDTVCPGCGLAFRRLEHLSDVNDHFFCYICHGDREVSVDEFVRASFTVAPRIRALPQHHPERLPFAERYFGCLVTRSIEMKAGGSYADYLTRNTRVLATLAPGERRAWPLELDGGFLLGGPGAFFTPVGDAAASPRLELAVSGRRLVPGRPAVPSGEVEVAITNQDAEPADLVLIAAPHPPIFARPLGGLSGKRLFHAPVWRELFGRDILGPTATLTIKDVAVLFSDLGGSTQLYQRLGDLNAWDRVRQHFQCLERAIEDAGGVWIKTIGDAVMATFVDPADAVRAGREMLRTIHTLDDLVLKVGVHAGPAIAVTMNHALDYFGHTVNVASRIQGIARGGELCVTDATYARPGVAGALAGVPIERSETALRGLDHLHVVWRARV